MSPGVSFQFLKKIKVERAESTSLFSYTSHRKHPEGRRGEERGGGEGRRRGETHRERYDLRLFRGLDKVLCCRVVCVYIHQMPEHVLGLQQRETYSVETQESMHYIFRGVLS